MSDAKKRLLFLCASRSIREVMAASLLAEQDRKQWKIWIAPGEFTEQESNLVRQVLEEIQVPLLLPPTAEPSFDRSWDEGIVLCSGVTDQ